MQVYGIAGKIKVHNVGCTDRERSGALRAMTLHFDLVLSQWNVVALCFLIDSVTNVALWLAGIGLESGLGLDVILKLVIFVINWNQLGPEIDSRANHADSEDKFYRTHRA